MDYDYLQKLKESHATLKLLNADHAPLIISFLHKVFVEPNERSLPYPDVESRLNDYLYRLREIYGEGKFPRSAHAYLEDWAGGDSAYLRKYYTDLSDVPHLDLTPATEKAVQWLQSLEERQFIGTESRLLTVFQLLREIVRKTEQDPRVRIEELERQRTEIDAEIEGIRREGIGPYDPRQIKEHFFQVEGTARRLLADFRQVEYNFRALDRETRERIAVSDKAKGALLDEIFEKQDVIWGSDQGKSFRAFWEFLMSPLRQAELGDLLERVFSLKEILEMNPDRFLAHIKYYLLDAGEKVYKTNNLLVEQLRKYLDNQAYLENKRIMELIKGVEKRAVEIKDEPPPDRVLAWLDDLKPDLDLIMCRSLFVPPKTPSIDVGLLLEGVSDVEIGALYEQIYVDEGELKAKIRKALQTRPQLSLIELIEQYPIERGLAEVVTYLNIASKDERTVINNSESETVRWTSANGMPRQARLPKIIFVR